MTEVLYAAAEEPLLNSCTVTGSVVEPKLFTVPLSVPPALGSTSL